MAQIFDFVNKNIIKNDGKREKDLTIDSSFKYNFESTISSEKIEINEKEYILKEEKKYKGNYYLDISYIKDGQSNLIGRYDTFCENISVENSINYILVYSWEFNRIKEKVTINKILTLYNKNDCTEIVGTFQELGKLFNDSTIKKQEFEPSNSNKLIYRTDMALKRRF